MQRTMGTLQSSNIEKYVWKKTGTQICKTSLLDLILWEPRASVERVPTEPCLGHVAWIGCGCCRLLTSLVSTKVTVLISLLVVFRPWAHILNTWKACKIRMLAAIPDLYIWGTLWEYAFLHLLVWEPHLENYKIQLYMLGQLIKVYLKKAF